MKLSGRIIGVDESGKGDFFGPLVVAAALSGPEFASLFDELYVRDSKKISDKRVLEIDAILQSRLAHCVVVMMPSEYNARYEQLRNLNILLAECHARAITGAMESAARAGLQVDKAVSDKFGKSERLQTALRQRQCTLRVEQIVRGESLPQVAAASIMARAEFLRRMDQLSTEFDLQLPKGAAAQVDRAGRELVSRLGPEVLIRVAKTHFKNFHRAMSGDLFA